MADSLKHTRFASLSRPVAGVIAGTSTFVVTLPGSPKAVKENMTSLLEVIDHALDLLRGNKGETVHKQLGVMDRQSLGTTSDVGQAKEHSVTHQQQQHQHHHHHHHHPVGHVIPTPRTAQPLSHDPSQPVSNRNRVSPWPLITFEKAVSLVLQHCKPLETITHPVDSKLSGHVTAEDVYAPHNVPNTKTSNVDGYALPSTFRPGVYDVVTPETHSIHQRLPIDTIMRINTGAPLPYGTDAVIMVEDTKLVQTDEDGEEDEVEMLAAVDPGENVRQPGSDVMKGEKVMDVGEIIGSNGGEIGTLVFVGRKEIKVHRKPVVAILSTGNELLDITSDPPPHPTTPSAPASPLHLSRQVSQVASRRSSANPSRRPSFNPLTGVASTHPQRPSPLAAITTDDPPSEKWTGVWDTNRPSLKAALEGLGYEVIDLGIVPDTIRLISVDPIMAGLRPTYVRFARG
ncbi:hypothetical protein FRC03_005501 [Tulasnella sp. 419]|nr:hypothetical protein FRC03_005501 [Tulasnella sp. 419]